MADAIKNAPTLDDHMAAIKGFTTVDGETRTETVEERDIGKRTAATDAAGKAAPAKVGGKQSTQERLAALDGDGKAPAKAAPVDEADDADANDPTEQQRADQRAQNDTRKADAQTRINKAVAKQRQAERERDDANRRFDDLQRRLDALEQRGNTPLTQTQQQNSVDAQAPNPAKYQYGELDPKFIADTARYEALKAFNEQETRRKAESDTQAKTRAAQETQQRFRAFEAAGLAKFDDFSDTVMESARREEWPLSEILGGLLTESEHGPDIAYYLATHVSEATRVHQMTAAQQAAWFGRREALLSTETPGAGREPNRVSNAPAAPTNPARGAGQRQQASADTTDFAAFEALATQNSRRQ